MRLEFIQTLRRRLLGPFGILLVAAVVTAFALLATQTGCSGEKCLASGENCTQAYLQDNGLTDHHCCNGQTCRAGEISGVLICRF